MHPLADIVISKFRMYFPSPRGTASATSRFHLLAHNCLNYLQQLSLLLCSRRATFTPVDASQWWRSFVSNDIALRFLATGTVSVNKWKLVACEQSPIAEKGLPQDHKLDKPETGVGRGPGVTCSGLLSFFAIELLPLSCPEALFITRCLAG